MIFTASQSTKELLQIYDFAITIYLEYFYEVILMENILNGIYTSPITENSAPNEAATDAIQSRVVTKPNFIRGSLELLVLYLLSQKDYYGYELTQLMDSLSDEVIKIPIGSLYPALYKFIEYGFISDHKEQVGKRMTRVYYHLEQPGFQRLNILLTEYNKVHKAISSILSYVPDSSEH